MNPGSEGVRRGQFKHRTSPFRQESPHRLKDMESSHRLLKGVFLFSLSFKAVVRVER